MTDETGTKQATAMVMRRLVRLGGAAFAVYVRSRGGAVRGADAEVVEGMDTGGGCEEFVPAPVAHVFSDAALPTQEGLKQ